MPGAIPDDVRFMRRALELAQRGAGQVWPNPKVGCVLVQDGEIVGEGWHQEYGGPHAEVHALAAAGVRARGATAYVTLEPCNHHGKTGPCTEALLAAGVARVVCATRDPNAAAAGGLERLAADGVRVESGVCEADARVQNAPFLHVARGGPLPFVTLKLAVSIDGAIAGPSRKRAWLTGPESQAAVHALRAEADAVAVGIGTAVADDPDLTVRVGPAPRVMPARVVFDRTARLPLDSRLVRTAREVPVYAITAPGAAPLDRLRALEAAGVILHDATNLTAALCRLRKPNGISHLFVEGGATLASALLAAGLVHHLIIFQAPVILGAGAMPAFAALPGREANEAPRLTVLERRVYGADLMTRYAVSGD
ncbi:MAG: bifunctional diaminohydroxyphosphoribosylaminopyrimidine deaminase/5-amino-6-(5-phosphoribosylamino)uracil reductase RibD [Gemmatimonas sp.]|uniref:bifunctional diaminohydroxyphosphoribosylaminopyrimidine deaminase/5-amino-6-(5-phosphoribosylamino)uracil reductase RibD n=2 Tax=Gemmatimonas sp. TaxID=1962908 RepID=UPI00391F7810